MVMMVVVTGMMVPGSKGSRRRSHNQKQRDSEKSLHGQNPRVLNTKFASQIRCHPERSLARFFAPNGAEGPAARGVDSYRELLIHHTSMISGTVEPPPNAAPKPPTPRATYRSFPHLNNSRSKLTTP
jgi:hypothetical protein